MKFEVGEVCYVRSVSGNFPGWRECTIVAIGDPLNLRGYLKDADYTVEVDVCSERGDFIWPAKASQLRKKRPPQTDTEIADESFIQDLKRMLRVEEVKA